MYLDHYGFQREPFNITPDSRFLFSSTRHKEAMAALLYGIEQRKGFIALTGEIGSGKTTICRTLLKELRRDDIRLALILNPQLDDLELLQAINAEYGIPHTSTSKRELLDELNGFLLEEYEKGNNCVLIIDESQRLSPVALEQVRLISNLELEDTKLIQIGLVGQPELDDLLHLPELEQLNQRITVRYHIDPLDFDEMEEYIVHRLHIAEPEHPVSFSPKALKAIYQYSGGIPRKINVLCDRCLLITFVSGGFEVSADHARRAIEEVRGKRRSRQGAKGAHKEDGGAAAAGEAGRPGSQGLIALAIVAAALVVAAAVLLRPRPAPDDRVALVTPATERTAVPTPPDAEPTQLPPSPTPEPQPGILPTPVVATPTPEAVAPTPAPTPEPTPAPTPQPTPEPTPQPTPQPTPAPTPAPTPEPPPPPTPSPTPQTIASAPTPVPTPAPEWSYDANGIMRVERPEFSFAACVLTWVSLARDQKLPPEELAPLRSLNAEEIARLQLTKGEPPLYLREAVVPTAVSVLVPSMLPALVQVDRRETRFGPWSVAVKREGDTIYLADPVKGRQVVSVEELERVLAGVVIPYSDEQGITGLKPGASGEKVRALQTRLRAVDVYSGELNGLFNDETEKAVQNLRARLGLPGASTIDPMLAILLLQETK
ncbi:MAG: ral secretion pathway protein [Candidatus Sumerlaeota bacterium]|nr:ral secretion pathway protein [Candidatus Sumerlaeota bacterium]